MDSSFERTLDVVIPLYNESSVMPLLMARLKKVFSAQAMQEHRLSQVHFIFVDDGSRDDSAAQITRAIGEGLPATLLRLSRNFGHQNAVTAGLAKSTASVTAVMDCDLQDPPEAILGMISLWSQGYDVVYAVRQKRKECVFKRFAYWLYYRLLSALAEIDVPRDSGDFGLMDRRVVRELMKLPEKLRFPRGLRAWVGFRQAPYEYERDARMAGESKYPFKELYRLATDGVISLSIRPLKLVQFCAFLFAVFFFVCLIATTAWAFRANRDGMELWFLVSYTLSALSGFFTLFSLFMICGYLGRMFFEVKGRPSFIIMEEVTAESLSQASYLSRRSFDEFDRVSFAT